MARLRFVDRCTGPQRGCRVLGGRPAGDEAAAPLEAMAAADRLVDELSEEQYQVNNQIQEDEVLLLNLEVC